MSFKNLRKRLQPAKKAWKIFTSALHAKLCKPNSSRSIKKSKPRARTTAITSTSIISRSHVSEQKKKSNKSHIIRLNRLPKRSAPVYIDELFNEPMVRSRMLVNEKFSASSCIAKTTGPHSLDGTAKKKKAVAGEGGSSGADDMWESLQVASPLMDGINERADEFIARIKAEMHLQETMARQL